MPALLNNSFFIAPASVALIGALHFGRGSIFVELAVVSKLHTMHMPGPPRCSAVRASALSRNTLETSKPRNETPTRLLTQLNSSTLCQVHFALVKATQQEHYRHASGSLGGRRLSQ